ncbi:hypothetical protein EI94DRAFT_925124 [Lactarius quietus]|nr:hypothetical protein EI94DRAFT_925124 [Lactarius quietus]
MQVMDTVWEERRFRTRTRKERIEIYCAVLHSTRAKMDSKKKKTYRINHEEILCMLGVLYINFKTVLEHPWHIDGPRTTSTFYLDANVRCFPTGLTLTFSRGGMKYLQSAYTVEWKPRNFICREEGLLGRHSLTTSTKSSRVLDKSKGTSLQACKSKPAKISSSETGERNSFALPGMSSTKG